MAVKGSAGFRDDALVWRGDEEAELAVETDDFELKGRGEALAAGGAEDPAGLFDGIGGGNSKGGEGGSHLGTRQIDWPAATAGVELAPEFLSGLRGAVADGPQAAATAVGAEAEGAEQEPDFQGAFDLLRLGRRQRFEPGGHLKFKGAARIESSLGAALARRWFVRECGVLARGAGHLQHAEDEA